MPEIGVERSKLYLPGPGLYDVRSIFRGDRKPGTVLGGKEAVVACKNCCSARQKTVTEFLEF